MSVPRSECPRPQFVRHLWLCLNGQWQFEIDQADSGIERGLLDRELCGEITVPFCPESPLSGVRGVDVHDFLNAVWYRRQVHVPGDWTGKRVLLHFQAADYDTTCWVNGHEVGRHRGGFSSFTFDITDTVEADETAIVVVRCRDTTRGNLPRGKQCPDYHLWNTFYVRTTGIWQTVWLEAVPHLHMKRPRIVPDVANRRFALTVPLSNNRAGGRLRATAFFEGLQVASAEVAADLDFSPMLDLVIPADHLHLWAPGEGNLYDIALELIDADGAIVDRAETYAGLRSVSVDGKAVKINGRVVFQRLVMDQGYYPDGIMTAPTDEALKRDVEIALAAGFNGGRLPQKVFEERHFYWADKLGYMLWAEFGDCGFDLAAPPVTMVAQWSEAIARDVNHPSIIGWCGLCETIGPMEDRFDPLADLIRAMFLAARTADPTRLVLDASGGSHRIAEIDVYDHHDYSQDPARLASVHTQMPALHRPLTGRGGGKAVSLPYAGQPYFISEFGGTYWNPDEAEGDQSWGYGESPKTIEQFYERFEGLCTALLDNLHVFAYCWTQLTDIYTEQNGIYHFDRRPKFDAARLRKAQDRPAAIEKA